MALQFHIVLDGIESTRHNFNVWETNGSNQPDVRVHETDSFEKFCEYLRQRYQEYAAKHRPAKVKREKHKRRKAKPCQ